MKIEKYFDRQLNKQMWRIDVTIGGRRHRDGKFPSQQNAEMAIAALRMAYQSELYGMPLLVQPVTVADLIERAKQKCQRPLQLRVIDLFQSVTDQRKPVNKIKRVDMARFLEELQKLKLKAGTITNYKQTLYGILNRAGEWFELLDEWTPPKFPRLEKPAFRQRTLSVDEMARLFKHWRNPERFYRESEKWRDYRLELYDIARLMLLTGARREEIEKITYDLIDARGGWLNLQSSKSRRWHAVPLNQISMEILKGRSSLKPMFRELEGSVIHYTCRRIGKAAGVPFGQQLRRGWTLHDLRRTAATHIESNGIAYSAVSATLGHRRRDVTAIYTPEQISEMRRASTLLENLWREIDEVSMETMETMESVRA